MGYKLKNYKVKRKVVALFLAESFKRLRKLCFVTNKVFIRYIFKYFKIKVNLGITERHNEIIERFV